MIFYQIFSFFFRFSGVGVGRSAVQGSSVANHNCALLEVGPGKADRGEFRWRGGVGADSPVRPAWEWVSISDSPNQRPRPSLPPSPFPPSLPFSAPLLLGGVRGRDSGEAVGGAVFSHGPILPHAATVAKLFSLTFLRYFSLKKIFGRFFRHLFPLSPDLLLPFPSS